MLPPVPFSVHHCCLRSIIIPIGGWHRSVLCTDSLLEGLQEQPTRLYCINQDLYSLHELPQMPSAESQWTVWKHGFQNSGAWQQILSWSSCLMHLFLKESGLDVLSSQVIWPTDYFNLFLEVFSGMSTWNMNNRDTLYGHCLICLIWL